MAASNKLVWSANKMWEYEDFDVEGQDESITEQLREQFAAGWQIEYILPSQISMGEVACVSMWRVVLKRQAPVAGVWRQLKRCPETTGANQ